MAPRRSSVAGGVKERQELARILGASWPLVLGSLRDAVIVMDRDRTLRFVNDAARSLLGYDEDEVIGGRCRLTTRGVDCECACPLTFALEHDMATVRDFAAVYRSKSGEAVFLNVTVVPLKNEDGTLTGAVEILQPIQPALGFYLAGASDTAMALRRQVAALGREEAPVLLVGEAPACADVARAIHRAAGLADGLFVAGLSTELPPWPPGTLFVDTGEGAEPMEPSLPAGWHLVVGVRRPPKETPGDLWQVLQMPALAERVTDLPMMLAAWVEDMSPGARLAVSAAQQLCSVAPELGLARTQEILATAVAAAGGGEIGEEHLAIDTGAGLVDEVLDTANPLGSLEARLLLEVLERHGWRMQEAADRLGMSRVTLWRKLREHGIQRPE